MQARHCGLGLPGESLVRLQMKNEVLLWDLACPYNTLDLFANTTVKDLNLE